MASDVNSPNSLCVDNLFLLGELLQSAVEYISRCQANFDQEQGQMVELVREQFRRSVKWLNDRSRNRRAGGPLE
jgi:hypothetical protein